MVELNDFDSVHLFHALIVSLKSRIIESKVLSSTASRLSMEHMSLIVSLVVLDAFKVSAAWFKHTSDSEEFLN
jgi:hypothetical protein